MGLGLGIFLLVVGLIFLFALDFDIAGIDDNALGWILVLAGILAVVLSLIQMQQARRSHAVVEERRDVV